LVPVANIEAVSPLNNRSGRHLKKWIRFYRAHGLDELAVREHVGYNVMFQQVRMTDIECGCKNRDPQT